MSYRYHLDKEKGVLFREVLTNKHLLWKPPFNGTPCIRKAVWDNYKDNPDVQWIGAKMVDGSKFRISKKLFNEHKKLIKFAEPQYGVEEYWWSKIF